MSEIGLDGSLFGQPATGLLNNTLLYTWAVMLIMIVGSWLITRKLSTGPRMSRWQNLLEVIVKGIQGQIREISGQEPGRYLPFIGTLFLFIWVSALLSVVPLFKPPTFSLSTTAALALCAFVAVPLYGIWQQGVKEYLTVYVKPSPLMLPFNLIGEVSRTLALAVRLFGNVMSGVMIGGVLVSIVPFVLPTGMDLLGLLTGSIQAYIFAILAMVYIASGTKSRQEQEAKVAPRADETAEKPSEKGVAPHGPA